jgi:hypothetical protein
MGSTYAGYTGFSATHRQQKQLDLKHQVTATVGGHLSMTLRMDVMFVAQRVYFKSIYSIESIPTNTLLCQLLRKDNLKSVQRLRCRRAIIRRNSNTSVP